MTAEQIELYLMAAELGTIPDDKNPLFLFSVTDSHLLLRILNDDFDLKFLARRELEVRGYSNIDTLIKNTSSQKDNYAKRMAEGKRKRKGRGL
jgi:hypothetical protein